MRQLIVALSLAAFGSAAWASPPDATAYQITVDHAGVTTSGGTLALQLTPRWANTLSNPIGYPLIVGNLVYAISGGLLYAFDIQSGSTVWGPVQVPSAIGATYDAGKVFVVSSGGLMTSFNATTGAAGWSVQLPGQYAFSSPPTASNGLVYVGGAGSGGTLYAVNEANGSLSWTAFVANGDNSSPAVGPSAVYVSYACLNTYSFNLTTGARNWLNPAGCEGGGGDTPVYANGRLYARDWASGNDIFDAQTGAILGSFASETPPAVDATTAYYLSSSTLSAVDLATGTVRWTFSDGTLTSAPIVVDQTVIIGGAGGVLYGLDELTGRVTWQVNTGYSIQSGVEWFSVPNGLAIADGVLVVPAGNVLLAYSIFGPPAPSNVTATGVAGGVRLNWSGASGATTYNIYESRSAGAEPFTPVLTGVSGTSVIVPGLTPGTSYYFTVKAVGPSGISAASGEATAVPLAVVPPAHLTDTQEIGAVDLSWAASSNATSYNIYQGTASGTETVLAASGVTGTSVTISGLTPGQAYYFVVKGVANGVVSAVSNEMSVTPLPAAPPTNLTGAPQVGGAQLTWAASGGATSYNVYVGTAAGAEGTTPVLTGITTTSAIVNNLSVGSNYYFVVRADVNGGQSGPSNEVSVAPQNYPSPQSLAITPGVGQLTITWDQSTAATAYSVFIGTAPGKEAATAVQTVQGTQAILTGLSSNSTYYLYVAAQTPIGLSLPSAEGSATPLAPPGPTNAAATAGDNSVTLTWSATAGATTYDVYEGTTAGGEALTSIQSGITGTSTTVAGLTGGTTYYFVIRAETAGGTTAASNEVSATASAASASSSSGKGGGGGALAWVDLVWLLGVCVAACRLRWRAAA